MPNFYYTDTYGQKHGLFNEEQLKSLVAQGIITPYTPLETEGGLKGLAEQIPGLFPTPVNLPPFVKTAQTVSHTANPIRPISAPDAIKKINLYFTWFWVCMLLSIPTFGLAMIPSIVFSFLLHYQLWKVIPSDIARTTPGEAIGFCFIPIFHFYWLFVTCHGLCKDMNAALRRNGIHHQVSEGLALTYCIFYLVISIVCLFVDPEPFDSIPNLAIGFLFVSMIIVLIFFYKSLMNGAIILLGGLQPGDSETSIENKKSPRTNAISLSQTLQNTKEQLCAIVQNIYKHTFATHTNGSLYCTNCGNSNAKGEHTCISCGADPIEHKKFCRHCGTGLNPEQVICVQCKTAIEPTLPPSNTFFTAMGMCFCGWLSLYQFSIGNPLLGWLMLAISISTLLDWIWKMLIWFKES